MSSLTVIVASTMQNGIGRGGTMPWHIPKDLAYFSRVTTSTPAPTETNTVIMGRKTWESIPSKFRPLKKRINVVLSRDSHYRLFPQDTEAHLCSDLSTAVETFRSQDGIYRLFIIGGSSLYQKTLGYRQPTCPSLQADRILITRIYTPEFDCDVFFPDVLRAPEWRKASNEEHNAWAGFEVPAGIQTENGVEFEFQMWVRTLERLGTNGEPQKVVSM